MLSQLGTLNPFETDSSEIPFRAMWLWWMQIPGTSLIEIGSFHIIWIWKKSSNPPGGGRTCRLVVLGLSLFFLNDNISIACSLTGFGRFKNDRFSLLLSLFSQDLCQARQEGLGRLGFQVCSPDVPKHPP